jgi:hypothetical protein
MRRRSGVSNSLALYVLVPAVGVACGFGMLAAGTSLGALGLGIGPLAGAAVSGWLARKRGRDAMPTLFIALFVATVILVATLFGLLVFALGQLPDGFEGS